VDTGVSPPLVSERLALGVPSLDRLLGGGLEPECLTMLYGEGGSGKTNLCCLAAVRAVGKGRWVLYVDTEGLSLTRLGQFAHGQRQDLEFVLKHLLLTSPRSLEEQEVAVENSVRLARERPHSIALVILDSATLLYRLTLGSEDEGAARQSLSAQLANLLHLAIEEGIPVLLTTQVFRDAQTERIEPIGGSFLMHAAKTVVRLERFPGGLRRATLVKHRSLPDGASVDFRLTDLGIEEVLTTGERISDRSTESLPRTP
jgi:DNA repair protein RadB